MTENMSLSLRQSIRLQSRVVGALLLREVITRYGRHNIGFLWLFIEPMLLTLGVTVLWHYTFHAHDTSLSVAAFAVTGYSCVQLWRSTAGRCLSALKPNLSLLYHRHVGVLEIFMARITLEIAGATAAFGLMVIVFSVAEIMPAPKDFFVLMSGWLLMAWFGAALGLALGAASEMSELVERAWHPVSYLLFPLSGAVYLVDWLPTGIQEMAQWIPMVNATELVRSGYFGEAVRAHYDAVWLIGVNMVMTLIGLFLCRLAEQRVEHE